MKTKRNKANSTRFMQAAKRGAMKAAVVTAASLALLGAATPALANTEISYGNGTIQVEAFEGQETTTKAFRIFNANKNADGTMSNFSWPTNQVRNAVVGVIQRFTPSYTSLNAQDAADYISRAYQNAQGNLTTNQNTILTNKELLNQIAAAVDDTQGFISVPVGELTTLAEGYWLLVTSGSSVGVDESGTSPIYTIVSGGPVKVTEKRSVPTVDKQILNDADGANWSYGTEAQRGQSISHKITGTVANNIKTYDLYYYEFEDVMSAGIDYDMGSYKVTIDGKDVTRSFAEKLTHNADGTDTLSVSCENILTLSGVTVTADSVLTMTYSVKLNDACIVGAAGNPNDVSIIYSSNPNTREKSRTHVVRDYLYTFALHMEKKDRDTNVSLAGAKFTIRATNPDDTGSKNLYVQADGRLGASPYEFVTNAEGFFEVNGLDAGTYTLHETKAPEMYQVVNEDTLFTIAATYNTDGTIKTLSNTVSENADAAAGIDTSSDHQVNGDAGTAAVVNTCYVNVTVGNIEKVKMPLSGQNGIVLFIAAGVGVVGISVAGLIIGGKKKKKGSGQEAKAD